MPSVEELQAVIASQQQTIANLTATLERLSRALEDDGQGDPQPTGYLSQRG